IRNAQCHHNLLTFTGNIYFEGDEQERQRRDELCGCVDCCRRQSARVHLRLYQDGGVRESERESPCRSDHKSGRPEYRRWTWRFCDGDDKLESVDPNEEFGPQDHHLQRDEYFCLWIQPQWRTVRLDYAAPTRQLCSESLLHSNRRAREPEQPADDESSLLGIQSRRG